MPRLSSAISGLSLFNLLVGGQSAKFYSEMSKQEEVGFDAAPGSWIKKMDPADYEMPPGTPGPIMAFAEVHLEPGHVRDMHWHLESDEWIYITEGTCEFTLMDSAGLSSLFQANKGDIAFFPKNWQHSFQAIDEEVGCDALLWFDKSDVTIDITPVVGYLPSKLLQQHLNDIPEDKLSALRFPVYKPNDVEGATGVVAGDLDASRRRLRLGSSKMSVVAGPGEVKGSRRLDDLVLFPVISTEDDGSRSEGSEGSAVEYRVDINNFPISQTMSGGVVHVKKGAVRELHWHPDSEEQIYVIEGKVEVTVQGIGYEDREYVTETFTLVAGDIVVFPEGFIHAFEAIDDDAFLALIFNTPSWESQALSTSFAVTPKHITKTTLDTTDDIVNVYFPAESYGGVFFPPKGGASTTTCSEEQAFCNDKALKCSNVGCTTECLRERAMGKCKVYARCATGNSADWKKEAMKVCEGGM